MLFKVFTIMTLAIAIPYSVIAKESFDEKVTGTPALSGHVQSSSSNIPGPRQVNIFTPEGFLIVSDATNVHGYYSYDGSMPSEVYVTTTYGGSIDELWPDIPCLHGNCDLTKGTLVDLSSGNRTIDFTLEPWTDPVFQSGFELIWGCEHVVTPEDVHGGQVRRVSNTHENYFGSTFPNLDNTDIVVDLGIDEYLAMSFVYQPHPVAANGASRLASLQANVTYGVPVVSTLTVSPCPGDFSVESQTVAEHCVAALDHAYGTFYFSPPGVGFPFCELEPGATYYINIIHTDDYLNELPYCQTVRNGRCALYMRQFGFWQITVWLNT